MSFDLVVRTPRALPGSDLGLLSYLESLTFDFHREGQDVSCVLVYAELNPEDGLYHCVVAQETGHEGIACVDDTARAALLALGVYERTGSRHALALARRWLTFVAYMQYPDGSFANFIRNAAGIRNASGPTSCRGGYAWSMRALWALGRAYRLTGDPAYLERFDACTLAPTTDGKVNAVLALANLEVYERKPSRTRYATIMEHCKQITNTEGAYFRDQPDSDVVHLWGYHQLHAVAEAARVLDNPDLLKRCRQTVANLVEPDVRHRFWYSFPDRNPNCVCAYNVTPVVQGLAAMYRATGARKYRDLAIQGCAWFYGRNTARTKMYDPTTGRCRDGIADGVASRNYGAESSIEAGLAELERRDWLSAS